MAPTSVQYWARNLASDYRYHGRLQEAPQIARTRLLYTAKASQRRDKRSQDACIAMISAVVVVTSVTPSVTHTMLASDIRRSINERSRRLDWEDHCEDLAERGPDCFRRQYRMPQETSKKNADILRLSPASTRPPFPRTLLDEMIGCIHLQCCTERECVLPTISHSPLTHSAI